MAQALDFAQLEALWIKAGGPKEQAPVAAAIALAESGGRVDALNPTPPDYSVGLWQINYYGSLGPGRTAEFGTPTQLRSDPLANARAAVSISSHGTNFSPWSTYGSGAYLSHLPGSPVQPSLGGVPSYSRGARPSGGGGGILGGIEGAAGDVFGAGESFLGGIPGVGGAVGFFEGLWGGVSSVADALKLVLWLFSPVHILQVFEILLGSLLMILGVFFLGTEAAGVSGGDDIGGAKDVAKTIGLGALIPVAGEAKVARAASGMRSERKARRTASSRSRSRIADRTPGDQRRAGFVGPGTLGDRPPRRGQPGSSRLGPGDSIPF